MLENDSQTYTKKNDKYSSILKEDQKNNMSVSYYPTYSTFVPTINIL